MRLFSCLLAVRYACLLRRIITRHARLWLLAALLAGPARADSPLLETLTPRLPAELLAEVSKSVLDEGKIGDRPGQRLRLSCYDYPLPPDALPGTGKPLFAWSCSTAWEQKFPIVSSQLWAPTAAELLGGTTDGDATALKEALQQKLRRFLKIKPDPKAARK